MKSDPSGIYYVNGAKLGPRILEYSITGNEYYIYKI